MLLLPEAQMGEAFELSKKEWSFGVREAWDRKVLSFFLVSEATPRPVVVLRWGALVTLKLYAISLNKMLSVMARSASNIGCTSNHCIIWVIKERRMRWAGTCHKWGRGEMHTGF
jgi:hypothetical protein